MTKIDKENENICTKAHMSISFNVTYLLYKVVKHIYFFNACDSMYEFSYWRIYSLVNLRLNCKRKGLNFDKIRSLNPPNLSSDKFGRFPATFIVSQNFDIINMDLLTRISSISLVNLNCYFLICEHRWSQFWRKPIPICVWILTETPYLSTLMPYSWRQRRPI